jgi:hypothetical protein
MGSFGLSEGRDLQADKPCCNSTARTSMSALSPQRIVRPASPGSERVVSGRPRDRNQLAVALRVARRASAESVGHWSMSSGPFGAELTVSLAKTFSMGLNSSPKMRRRGLLAGNYQRHDVMMHRDTE